MISLIILLWMCGALVTLSISAKVNGMVRFSDVIKIFALWILMMLAEALCAMGLNTVIWRKKP